jgi:hypothetical protein
LVLQCEVRRLEREGSGAAAQALSAARRNNRRATESACAFVVPFRAALAFRAFRAAHAHGAAAAAAGARTSSPTLTTAQTRTAARGAARRAAAACGRAERSCTDAGADIILADMAGEEKAGGE